jgi:hypothetical protein
MFYCDGNGKINYYDGRREEQERKDRYTMNKNGAFR